MFTNIKNKFWQGGGIVTLTVTLPFITLLYMLGQFYTALWVTPEMLRLWPIREIAYVGSSMLLILYLLVAGGALAEWYFQRFTHPRRWSGMLAGWMLGLPIVLFYGLTHRDTREIEILFSSIAGLSIVYGLWGLGLYAAFGRFHAAHPAQIDPADLAIDQTRRKLLQRGVATSAASIATLTVVGRWLLREQQEEIAKFVQRANLPPTLSAKLYPMSLNTPFPEMGNGRFQPTQHPFGVCFSGGGLRAYSAAVGQLRGLVQLGLLDSIGALSGVSGGGLMVTLFSYAPNEIDDTMLLGTMIPPEQLTVEQLATIDPQHITASLLEMTDVNMTRLTLELEEIVMLTGALDQDQLYARVLNHMFLKPFGLNDVSKFYSLDSASVNDIVARNPALSAEQFYTIRPNRPYPIISVTHVFPIGFNPGVRDFECTPLYTGTAQQHPNIDNTGMNFGGGYIENIAFNVKDPIVSGQADTVTVVSPPNPFTLSDMVGSTSALPGAILNKMGQPDLMPAFSYLPIDPNFTGMPREYSFIDGNIIENIGIVPLLRRQYPVVLAFVNSGFPIGLDGQDPFDILDFSIGQLFGYVRSDNPFHQKNTQIFPQAQFDTLAEGLKQAKREKRLPVFVDRYPIVQPNHFDIAPYPGDGKVTVVWFYNELYNPWYQRLPEDVKAIMADPINRLDNFPHYKTILHNVSPLDIPELFYLTPEQINLLSQMWTYAMVDGAAELLDELRTQ